MYHVNPETGKTGKCRAEKNPCPFGLENHFPTNEEAHEHWEKNSNFEYMPPMKKTLVVSDIDGTLVKSSLVLENAVELHEAGVMDLGDLPIMWKADMKNEELITALATKYKNSLLGRKESFVNAKKTVDRIIGDRKNFYSSIDTLIEQKKQGAEVVLISGSPDFLVKHFANHFGFKYYASEYHRDENKRFNGEIHLMAGSEAKRKVLKEKINLEDYDHIIGVGDTFSDSPLLEAAKHSILVAPTEETLKKLKELKVKIHQIIHS